MPTYNFKNKETGEVWEVFLSISEREELLKDPNIEQVHVGAPMIVGGLNQKPSEGFRDILKQIKKNNVRSNINTF